ncbi:MAG: hypothetical protein ABIT08_08905 [Bacteroidia bacterium]
MKARQLNKLYQLMRISRVFHKRKEKMNAVPGMKKVIKSFDDKIDDLLIYALKQKENITYAARQKREIRDELTKDTVFVCMKASVYFETISDFEHLFQVNYTLSDLKKLSEVVFPLRITNVLNVALTYKKELKSWGLSTKELQRIEESKKEYLKIVSLPRLLQTSKSTKTDLIKRGLKELTKIQFNIIDKIAKSFFEPVFLKNEYRKARKIVHHKHPEGMFDEMLRIYRGVKKNNRLSKKQVLRSLIKEVKVSAE